MIIWEMAKHKPDPHKMTKYLKTKRVCHLQSLATYHLNLINNNFLDRFDPLNYHSLLQSQKQLVSEAQGLVKKSGTLFKSLLFWLAGEVSQLAEEEHVKNKSKDF